MSSFPNFKNLTNGKIGELTSQQRQSIQGLVEQHIESFNFLLDDGLNWALQDIPAQEFKDIAGRKVSLVLQEATIGTPSVPESNVYSRSMRIFPAECRERASTYAADLQVTVGWLVDGQLVGNCSRIIGQVPIMVKSARCHLACMKPAQMVQHHEEAEEWGGYFVVNGNEKILRMLILPRRNYPIAIVRPSWKQRGNLFTEFGISMRCVRRDQSAANLVLHYLSNGTCMLTFFRNKQQYLVPVIAILKALIDITDKQIFDDICLGNEDDTFIRNCAVAMLRQAQNERFFRRDDVLRSLGKRLRVRSDVGEWCTDQEVAESIIKQEVAVHLSNNTDKYNLLIFMIRKLISLVAGKSAADSADSPMNQEILLGGHFLLQVIKEKLLLWLRAVRFDLTKTMRLHPDRFDLSTTGTVLRAMKAGPNIGQQLEYLLATGNLISKSGLALQQTAGFALMADKLNFYRYMSHFRCVHRGAFFAEMRTTAVRRLLPEAWGFLCPVHTPDGAPCGLLNHLTALCRVTASYQPVANLPSVLTSLGMQPFSAAAFLTARTTSTHGESSDSSTSPPRNTMMPVILDGKVIGFVAPADSAALCNQLRRLKVIGKEVPSTLEVGLVPVTKGGPYPGLYLFSGPGRMVRPVVHLAAQTVEMIGSFEQVYMDIAVRTSEIVEGVTTHQEVAPDSILSVIGSLTPFSDFNQSPRNVYQCQMGKQTMGTPAHSLQYRMDNKLYRLQTPQTPMVRPMKHDLYGIDDYPPGTNAIVAVIAYTGYDMEDAMILNRSSVQRGFAAATIYKSTLVDLTSKQGGARRTTSTLHFGVKPGDRRAEGLEADGFPSIGSHMKDGMPFYSYVDRTTGVSKVETYRGEEGVVGQVKLLGNSKGDLSNQKAYIKLRVERNPIVGDKMASRHGQKGVCSRLYPLEDMPFTESGMVPDIIFNPHGFPSRMTIGMMIESMAGKSAAAHGLCYDATPFTYSEQNSAIDFFGRTLVKAGYNYYGNERFYSGVGGRELKADIFVGTVYYQRLRHMVSDKFQVRTTGPVDPLTHQPVKGRKRAGGIRFGEMERDALLAHGTSFLLHDRLFHCSDRCVTHVCTKCGSLLSPCPGQVASGPGAAAGENSQRGWTCRTCNVEDSVKTVAVPYVFRYLTAELAAMNINMRVDTKRM